MNFGVTVEERERAPGLSEETIKSILKDKRAYPHEVVSMAKEILELRTMLNAAPKLQYPDAEKTIFTKYHKEQADKAAIHVGEFPWRGTPQGYPYWNRVYDNLIGLRDL